MGGANWGVALGSTLLAQIVVAFVGSSVLVSAPLLTQAMGVPVENIGYFASISTLGTMWYLMSCGPLLPRFGPLRLLQWGLALSAFALLLALLADWTLFLVCALLIGLCYGPVPPASSEILARHAPAHRRSLAFSIKQAGVPAGFALGGVAVPFLAVVFDWRVALLVVSAVALFAAILLQPWRARLDSGYSSPEPLSIRAILAPVNALRTLQALRVDPALPWLTFASFCFACSQGVLFSYYVVHLTETVALPVTLAGLAYASLQVAGAFGRIGAGWIADRTSGRITLTYLAFLAMGAHVLTASLGPGLPGPLLLAVTVATGLAAVSWNGVYLAELARIAPEGKVGEATAGSTFFTFIGYAVGPAFFAFMVGWTGSYALAFLLIAALPLTGGLSLLHTLLAAAREKPE